MIRSPMEGCRERKWETASVSFAVVVVLAVPLAIALFAFSAHEAAREWLADYTPIVYLAPQTSPESAAALADELSEWPLVASAAVREPAEARVALIERLGEDAVESLEITDGMLPTSIVIEPAVPVAGHIDLVSRVSGLEARMEVDAVEVPSSDATQVVHFAAYGLAVAVTLSVLGFFAALILLLSFFQRLRKDDDDTDRVLALFGARPAELRRPTLVRGLVVGGWCGAAVTAAGAFSLLLWQLYAPAVAGVEVSASIAAWSTVMIPLVAVPFLGFVAAWHASSGQVQILRGRYA